MDQKGRIQNDTGRRDCFRLHQRYEPKRIDTLAVTATLSVSKTMCYGNTPFYLKALDCGRRFEQAVMVVSAVMYFKGVATRDVEGVLNVMGFSDMSPSKSATRPRGLTTNWRGGASERLRRRDISTPGTRIWASTGPSATSRSSRRSASCQAQTTCPLVGGACWGCP